MCAFPGVSRRGKVVPAVGTGECVLEEDLSEWPVPNDYGLGAGVYSSLSKALFSATSVCELPTMAYFYQATLGASSFDGIRESHE